ncbi:hypothetical protein J1605_006043 [Eschrichtius robustus]|uniref:RNA-binding protein with serine-rich domain 1 n=1 Tax=Eschrichtius robustus TaxID=9764 RepID=A0AB34H4K3_ESCRO|nr:hypothetical protein J1605_006043 [Eschrichtius robustus]
MFIQHFGSTIHMETGSRLVCCVQVTYRKVAVQLYLQLGLQHQHGLQQRLQLIFSIKPLRKFQHIPQLQLQQLLWLSESFSAQDHIMEIFSTYGKIKMIDMPVERMHPHLSKGYAYVEFENPDEAEKALKHMDGGSSVSHSPWTNRWPGDNCHCCAGPLASATPQAIQPSQENAATASHVAQVTPTDEEKVTFPSAQVPRAPAIPLPWPPPPQEPLQLQLLPISRATEALPCDLYPIQLNFCHFPSRRRIALLGALRGRKLPGSPQSLTTAQLTTLSGTRTLRDLLVVPGLGGSIFAWWRSCGSWGARRLACPGLPTGAPSPRSPSVLLS